MSKRAPSPILKKLNWLYHVISHPYSFFFILLTIIAWFVVGSFMHFSDEWYKIFHLFEIVVALLMVFLIENSTHNDNRAMQEKLDEIIKAIPQASNDKAGIEKHFKGEEKESL